MVVNQFSVQGDKSTRRPDVVAFVNGIPLGLIELKVPGAQGTLRGACDQLRTYASQIPTLLTFTAVNVISTGTQARMGALGGRFEHYAPGRPSTASDCSRRRARARGAHPRGLRAAPLPRSGTQLRHLHR